MGRSTVGKPFGPIGLGLQCAALQSRTYPRMERREVVRAFKAVSETRRERMRPQPCAEVRDALQLGAGRCAGVPVSAHPTLPYLADRCSCARQGGGLYCRDFLPP